GTATDDNYPRGSQLSVTWSGPSGVTFADAHATTTTATFAAAGTYTLRLTATDGTLTAFDEVVITVDPQNAAPVVNAGADQIVELPAAATLAGTATDDGYPRGSQLAIPWRRPSSVALAGQRRADRHGASSQHRTGGQRRRESDHHPAGRRHAAGNRDRRRRAVAAHVRVDEGQRSGRRHLRDAGSSGDDGHIHTRRHVRPPPH